MEAVLEETSAGFPMTLRYGLMLRMHVEICSAVVPQQTTSLT